MNGVIARNTTIQNRSKQQRLSSEHVIPFQNVKGVGVVSFLQSLNFFTKPKEQILFSIGCHLLKKNRNPAVRKFLAEYDYEILDIQNIPENTFDLLGSIYQFLNTKKENLEKGSFYTGSEIAKDFVNDLDFSSGQIIFDPACGSGSFLFNSNAPAEQIVGVDSDPIAIMIAKFNYFIKFPRSQEPRLFCYDFFDWFPDNRKIKFDYVISNPPYGANLDLSRIPTQFVSSGESFSYFIEFGYQLLKSGGVLRFLLPEAILNVKRHTDIRDFILDQTNLRKIKRYSKKFSGVMSDVYMIELDRGHGHKMLFINDVTTVIPKKIFRDFKNHILVHLNEQDITIIEKVDRLKRHDLSNSIFGLGVVTGDNMSKLLDKRIPGSEPIYTGKEVNKYKLLTPRNYLVFDREKLQQVAPDEIYRAPKKLVYKTINKFLKVALDTTRSLTTNSANIVIPRVPELDIYVLMAFLNSDLYSYLNLKLFGGVNKIAKENLMALPFPGISKTENTVIKNLVKDAIKKGNDEYLQKYINKKIFKLSEREIAYIKGFVTKK
ncbi:MAG: N-6 DNA methylase [Patescibacteria group bacterium]|jgi:type I restriction-modification system DNA methylase subunit